ncbi:MAG TPA: sulfotransferase [Acidobacteriota bacterium]|nr:sulfotransferase [Acidobacteriota bacterium]
MYSPIFVVGSARSGTTLLYSILLSSGKFAVYQAETLLLEVCKPKYGNLKIARNYKKFINDWLHSKQFYRSALDPDEFTHVALNHHETYIEFMRHFMEHTANKQGKKRWAEQTPGHVFYVSLLSKSFPDAKFVHMIRDGRDVAVSKRKLGWSGTKSGDTLKQLIYAAKSWEMSVKAGRKQGGELGDRYMEIRYEDMVHNNIDDVLARISHFADISVDRKRIESSTQGSLGKANTAYDNQSPGISSKGVGRWKTELNNEEKNALHYAIGQTLTELRYELDSTRPDVSWKVKTCGTLYPFILNLKRYLKNETVLGRFTSDELEIGLK